MATQGEGRAHMIRASYRELAAPDGDGQSREVKTMSPPAVPWGQPRPNRTLELGVEP